MLKWLDVIKYANKGNLSPDFKVEKKDEEWKAILTEEQYYVTRQKGTERAHSSGMCTFLNQDNTIVFAATPRFSILEKNSILVQDGRRLHNLLRKMQLPITKICLMGCIALKPLVILVMLTLVMSFKMDQCQVDFDIA